MPYGTIKVDNIIFTNGGSDQTVTVSGIVASTSGNLTVTGTISGGTVVAPYGSFTSLTGVTTSGTNANFQTITGAVGVYTTSVSGRAVNALTANIVSGVFASGTAAAPSITFTGNTAAGIYSPGTDQVAISTSGTGRLFVDASGRIIVGASTAAIGHPLEIAGNANGEAIGLRGRSSDGISYIGFYPTASSTENARIQSADTAFLSFHTGSSTTERMRLDSSGRLGLGTSSPGAVLDVSGSGNIVRFGDGTNTFDVRFKGPNNWAVQLDTSADKFNIQRNSSSLVTVDSSGRVGIGTTSVTGKLEISSATAYAPGNAFNDGCVLVGNSGSKLAFSYDSTNQANITALEPTVAWRRLTLNAGDTVINSSGSETARFSSGKLLVGTSTARSNFFNSTNSARFQIEGSGSNDNYALSIVSNYAGSTNGAQVILAKSGGSNVGDNTLVSDGNIIGQVNFQGADGTEFVSAASITGEVDGTPGANDMPGRLVFSTTLDGAASPTERMRISNKGVVSINISGTYGANTNYLQVYNGTSSQSVAFVSSDSAGNEWHFGRHTSDGNFYVVRQTGTGMYMSTNSWVATSDQRAKQNIADIESTIDVVKALKPSRFNWKSDGTADVGFIAQQVQALIPEAVVDSGNPDAMLGITQDKLLPFVVKALQEAIDKIESLEARLTAAGIE